MKLLKSGRVPEERLGTIVDIVGTRGNENDLAYLFERVIGSEWPVELRRQALDLLIDAAGNRKVLPAVDLSPLAKLIADAKADSELRLSAVRYAGAAGAKAAVDALTAVAKNTEAPVALRAASLNSLVSLAKGDARPTVEALLAGSHPYPVRAMAVSALAEIDLAAGATAAADLLKVATPADDPAPVVDALLNRKGGAEQLAAAVAKSPPETDVAKLALRHMYSIGRSDESLVSALGKAAGIESDPQPLTPEELAALIEEVRQQGDPARGEEVFRRSDLSCMKCHSVSAAGGQVGPDLSAVGSISPIDYLINSIMTPDLAIKEKFITRVVATVDGEVIQGIVVERSAEKLTLKDANGVVRTIATADIDQEVEGKSLMPKGLVRFMTHQEFVDVVKFLSQLGRQGAYAIRTTPRFQRYRVLVGASKELVDALPNDEQFEAAVLRSTQWVPFYARVNGQLPLQAAAAISGSPVVYLYTEFEVTEPGAIGVQLDSPAGVHAWLDDESFDLLDGHSLNGSAGRHRFTLRVDTRERPVDELEMELHRVEGSSAEFRPVDGS
jgi:putative heme-binding domain-containing protein